MRRAANGLERQHPGKRAIGREARSAGEMALGVAARNGLADDVQGRAHRAASAVSAAARWIAATIGSYPVQRQTLPASASMIVSRDGFGSRSSRAVATTTMPGVQ